MSDSYIKQRDEAAEARAVNNLEPYKSDMIYHFQRGADWARRHTLMSDEVRDLIQEATIIVNSYQPKQNDFSGSTERLRNVLERIQRLMKEME